MSKKLIFSLALLSIISLLSVTPADAKRRERNVVRLETTMGVIRIRLSDQTPIHRDNFKRLVQEGYYDGTLFHRVIRDFMIQGGDPTSKGAPKDSLLGDGEPGYTLPAEIVYPDLYHRRGMVAAAREPDEVNPEFRSSGSQFYIVWGRKHSPQALKKVRAALMDKGIEMDHFIADAYEVTGGTPHLDGTYTVFGEVIEGLEVVRRIQLESTDAHDRPLTDVVIKKATLEKR